MGASGDSKNRAWRNLIGTCVITLALAAMGGAIGYWSTFSGPFPALGGPNAYLYDLALGASRPWRETPPEAPGLFVALDDASLDRPEFKALPRALFQPIWAKLIDGLLDNGAKRVAFDIVFAYAGADFRVGAFALADYDRGLIDALTRGRDRLVLGRYPSLAPAPAFVKAVGQPHVGVLDVQIESDGRVRSMVPLARLPDGKLAFGFAGLAAGLTPHTLGETERLLVSPSALVGDVPSYSIGTLLDCLADPTMKDAVRAAIEGRIVVVGTAVAGEDEHRGPTRYFGSGHPRSPTGPCSPILGAFAGPDPDLVPGALLQLSAIRSAMSAHAVRLADPLLRAALGALLAGLFSFIALRDEAAFRLGARSGRTGWAQWLDLGRTSLLGVLAPGLTGFALSLLALTRFDLWVPMGYPIVLTSLGFASIVGVRAARHRLLVRRLYQTAGRYLPPARLSDLARAGFADNPGGQEREVSILLADLAGFTAFSNDSGRRAAEVVKVANAYFSMMQRVIDRHGGCSDKFLGDAVLAFWNGLTDEPDHAIRAVLAARDILNDAKITDVSALSLQPRLGIRAVVCTGRVYVGDLGAKERRNFTIIGPAVNETFRLEKLPDLYGVPLLVAGETVEAIKAYVEANEPAGQRLGDSVFVRIDNVELKGFAGHHAVYALVPANEPGLKEFMEARQALDVGAIEEARRGFEWVNEGMLTGAAQALLARMAAKAAGV
jgi:adenylate cyclase